MKSTPDAKSEGRLGPSRAGLLYFSSAASLASVAVLTLFTWPMIDASFRYANWLLKIDVGLAKVVADPAADAAGVTDAMLTIANGWDQLGSRVALLLLVYSTGFAATALLLMNCIRVRSVGCSVTMVVIVSAWIVLFTTRSGVEEWSLRRQTLQFLPRVETAATELTAHWPTQSTDLTCGVHVIVSNRRPNALIVVGRRSYPIREDFGYLIERSANETIRFELSGAFDYKLEFHPSGSQPAAYKNAFDLQSSHVTHITRLKERWYLVRYGNEPS